MYRKTFILLAATALAVIIILQLRGIIQIPPFISLGIINIPLYGLIILSAILSAVYFGKHIADEKVKNLDELELLLWILVPGIIGARLYHVITDFQLYTSDPVQIFNFANGGLGFLGALGGGVIGLYFYARHHKLNIAEILRPGIVVVPLAQAIGRLGNLINQEIYGPATDLPWGIYIRLENRVMGYETWEYFHPLFLYEMLANLLLFAVLYYFYRKGLQSYRLVTYYLAVYGAIRFCLDFLRLEGNTGALGLSYTQWLILGAYWAAILFGIGYQLWYKRKYGKWFTSHT